MSEAFRLLANGDFEGGLNLLHRTDEWRDQSSTLDGPFFLGFPDSQGWGEGLFAGSLLKRAAAHAGKRINVTAPAPVRSILKHDEAFDFELVANAKPRPPTAVLQDALLGTLLDLPFKAIATVAKTKSERKHKPVIGITWASMSNGQPIQDKSAPASAFGEVLSVIDADFVSFQRKLEERDQVGLNRYLGGRCTFLSDDKLDADDQTEIVTQIAKLDCMFTISTTAAQIAACMGVDVILLVARRNGPQWFWRAQAEHGKIFYPFVDIHLGDRAGANWFERTLESASLALAKSLAKAR